MTSHRPLSLALAALLPCLLLVISSCSSVQSAPAPAPAPAPQPLFGLGLLASLAGLDSGLSANGTSALGLLALSHLQHKLDTLAQIGELFGVVGANGTLLS